MQNLKLDINKLGTRTSCCCPGIFFLLRMRYYNRFSIYVTQFRCLSSLWSAHTWLDMPVLKNHHEDQVKLFTRANSCSLKKEHLWRQYSNLKPSDYQKQVTSLVDILSTQLQVH